ncbi:hypothetical protein Ddye_013619 [Dipteronia dyeriana]|uniref:Reverse transcriptase n=1 Tax=Dipteronia dyeriana TaxID=168575 RepID=A0AAD9X6R8_9ROSI|nr:hypothetical protein Ddye_013619 [Dipteronia dyeriana]
MQNVGGGFEKSVHSKFVKVGEGVWGFNVAVEKEDSMVDIGWLTETLELKFEFLSEKKKKETDQKHKGGVRRSDKEDGFKVCDGMEKDREAWVKVKSRRQSVENHKSRDSFNQKYSPKAGLYHLKDKENMEKGKQLYVRRRKMCPDHMSSLTGSHRHNRFGPTSEECPLSGVGIGLSRSNKSFERSSSGRPIELRKCSSNRAYKDGVLKPHQLSLDQNREIVLSYEDQEGGVLSLPLNCPVQLPMRDSEGGKILGKDLKEVPFAINLETVERIYVKKIVTEILNKMRLNWDLGRRNSQGFDFQGKENALGEVIARREKGDDEKLAAEIGGLTFTALWCVGGEFNTILDPSDRIGMSVNTGSIRRFASFVAQANIIYIPLHGMSYTWSNNREKEAWARLDRFLLSLIILGWFPKLFQWGLPRSLSDHNPVMIGVLPECKVLFPFVF